MDTRGWASGGEPPTVIQATPMSGREALALSLGSEGFLEEEAHSGPGRYWKK